VCSCKITSLVRLCSRLEPAFCNFAFGCIWLSSCSRGSRGGWHGGGSRSRNSLDCMRSSCLFRCLYLRIRWILAIDIKMSSSHITAPFKGNELANRSQPNPSPCVNHQHWSPMLRGIEMKNNCAPCPPSGQESQSLASSARCTLRQQYVCRMTYWMCGALYECDQVRVVFVHAPLLS